MKKDFVKTGSGHSTLIAPTYKSSILPRNAITLVLCTIALLISATVSGQGVRIPGDTTGRAKKDSVIYGPNTTKYIDQHELKFNQVDYKTIDTLLTGVHDYSPIETLGNSMQYLGAIGSAAIDIFPVVPKAIGASPGFNAYDIYYTTPEDVKFYNTRSPYTQLVISFGGNNRSVNDITFSRNITSNWNVGANVKTLSINKQLGPPGSSQSQDNKYAQSYYYNFFTHYQTKNKKYDLMAVLSRFSHTVRETGGIVEDTTNLRFLGLEEFYQYKDASVWFIGSDPSHPSPVVKEFRFDYHLYHQYKINDYLQAYHEFDLYHQHNSFFYSPTGNIDTSYYFKQYFLDSTRTADFNRYKLLQNEIGIKGNLSVLFYNVYFKLRNTSMEYVSDTSFNIQPRTRIPIQKANELYGGFNLRLDFGGKTYLSGGAEYLNTNSYRLQAEFNNPILKASYTRARAVPSYLDQNYLGNHNYWEGNNFGSVAYDQLKGSLEYQFGFLYLRPSLTATNVNNPIYYRRDTVVAANKVIRGLTSPDRQAFPEQADGGVQVLSPGLEFRLNFLQKLHMENKVTYSLVSGPAARAFPIPDLYAFSRLYFMNQYIEGKLTLQLGVDVQLSSAYLGYDYDLSTQQFFIQRQRYGAGNNVLIDNFRLPHPDYSYYAVADLFFVMKVRKVRLYLKIPQINKGLLENGYFASPFYTGQNRVLDLGVNWLFFD